MQWKSLALLCTLSSFCVASPAILAETQVQNASEENDAAVQAAVSAINTEQTAKKAAKEHHNTVVVIERKKVLETLSLGGTVTARKAVSLKAQTAGRVSFVFGAEGERFQANTTLIGLSDEALRAQLYAALARRDAARAQIHNAQMQYQRELNSPRSNSAAAAPGGMGMPAMMDQMFSKPIQNVMGMRNNNTERASDLTERSTQVAQAHTSFREAEAQIQGIKARLRDSRSVAPFAGVIVNRHVEVGDTVQPGMPLISINAHEGFQIQVDVPARLQSSLQINMPIQVRLDGQKAFISTHLARVFPVLDPNEHTIKVELDLPLTVAAVSGMYAEVLMPETTQNNAGSLTIPASAISRKGGLPMVFLLDENNQAKLRIIRLGRQIDDEHFAVLSGVQEGDRIVCRPQAGLKSGDVVDVKAAIDSQGT